MTDLEKHATDAWVYGYPLVLMDVTRQVTSTHDINTFHHMRTFPDHTFHDVVSPNADTLYSSAWLDLSDEPMVLSLPALGDRYVMMPILSGWTDIFASLGSRTTGNQGGHFAICPPGWSGELPDSVTRIDSPTSMAWIIGRTSTAGTKDYLAVHAMQDQYRLTPLSAFVDGTPYQPAQPPAPASLTAPVDQVAAMDGSTFFIRLGQLLVDNPPLPRDKAAEESLAALGIRPGTGPNLTDPQIDAAVAAAPSSGRDRLRRKGDEVEAARVNGWTIWRGLGDYGTDYATRAYIAFIGLGANLDADAMYPRATVDSDDRPLVGDHHYVLHFAPDRLPPVNGFWSLTLYDDKQFFVDNPIDRYVIGERDDLVFGEDGSLDIWVQHEDPGADAHGNWLPAPAGAFNVVLRAYWPQEAALNGEWTPPPLTRLY
jgi:hypothetical protein